jgi:hypothetical protein
MSLYLLAFRIKLDSASRDEERTKREVDWMGIVRRPVREIMYLKNSRAPFRVEVARWAMDSDIGTSQETGTAR